MRISKSIMMLVVTAGMMLPALAQKQAPPAGGPPKPFVLPAKQRFTLPNGLAVTLVPYGSIPKADVAVVVGVGSNNEAAEQVWLSSLTAQLMKEGTKSRTAEQVSTEAAGMGGDVTVTAGPDQTVLTMDVLSEFAPQAARLLGDVAQNPLLPESDFQRLKKDQLRRLSIAKTLPAQIALERFRKTLYPDHPYGRVFPTEGSLGKLTWEDSKQFYAQNFGAARTHIYVAGKFNAAAVKAAIEQAFGGWPRGPRQLVNIPKTMAKRSLELVDKPGAAQSTLYIGLPTVEPSNPDYVPMLVMDSLLGGSFGSRITSNIREQKGYTYSPNSQISARYRDAYWVEVADVTTAVTGPSIKEIFGEIKRLQKDPPAKDELEGIQKYMAGIFVLRNSSRQGIVNQLVFQDLHGLGDEYLNTYVQRVYSVTPGQVQELAKKYIQEDKMAIVVVGDREKIADQIAVYKP